MLKKLATPVIVFVIFILSLGIVSAQDNLPNHVPPIYEGAIECMSENSSWADANVYSCFTSAEILVAINERWGHDEAVARNNIYEQNQEDQKGKSDLIMDCGWLQAHYEPIISEEAAKEAILQCYWAYAGPEVQEAEYEISETGMVIIIDDGSDDTGSDDDVDPPTGCTHSSIQVEFVEDSDGDLYDTLVHCAGGLNVTFTYTLQNGDTVSSNSNPASNHIRFQTRSSSVVSAELRVTFSNGVSWIWMWS